MSRDMFAGPVAGCFACGTAAPLAPRALVPSAHAATQIKKAKRPLTPARQAMRAHEECGPEWSAANAAGKIKSGTE